MQKIKIDPNSVDFNTKFVYNLLFLILTYWEIVYEFLLCLDLNLGNLALPLKKLL